MRWARSLRGSLRGRLTLAMLLVLILGLVVSAVLYTRETRQEAVLSTPQKLRIEAMDQRKDVRRALVGIFLEEAIEWFLVFVPLAMTSFALVWLTGWWSLHPLARASRQAAAIGPANPSGRLYTDELPREIRALVDVVNGALERLDHAYARAKVNFGG